MIRLLYFSHAMHAISREHIDGILQLSRRNNAIFDITGILVQGGGLFMQVLEGPEQAVLRLYVKLLDDPMHSDCRIVNISPVKERMFQKWSMGCIDGSKLLFQQVTELRANRLETVHAKAVNGVMREFRDKLIANKHENAINAS
jgi:uncharacterized Fe-S cluster-containing radical SAM superfamily protein